MEKKNIWERLPLWLRFLLAPLALCLIAVGAVLATLLWCVWPLIGGIIAIATNDSSWIEYSD